VLNAVNRSDPCPAIESQHKLRHSRSEILQLLSTKYDIAVARPFSQDGSYTEHEVANIMESIQLTVQDAMKTYDALKVMQREHGAVLSEKARKSVVK
jgi:hypothetical protein